ncbi:hypothetical protein Tsp_07112 [Trichinella spiralis]|uniref:hypothetical protein n=1 Tax=Trichinella spiralis TaxID=6334 RepID=UPI0001EFBB65|nr:hypothetical protein Tsp_07112 [Trichinella spiralis]
MLVLVFIRCQQNNRDRGQQVYAGAKIVALILKLRLLHQPRQTVRYMVKHQQKSSACMLFRVKEISMITQCSSGLRTSFRHCNKPLSGRLVRHPNRTTVTIIASRRRAGSRFVGNILMCTHEHITLSWSGRQTGSGTYFPLKAGFPAEDGRVPDLRAATPQAEAPPIDKEKTLRNTDWLEADRTRKAEVRIRSE